MPRLSTPLAVLITIVLASLLIFYVFAGGRVESGSQSSARCSSQEVHEQIKREVFRRAAVLRGGSDATFAQVAAYSVVRTTAPAVRRAAGKSGATCTSPIVLDLPPGVQAIGGRRSLAAKLAYSVETAEQGRSQLRTLGDADPIVLPLATIGRTESQEGLAPSAAEMETVPAEAEQPAAESPARPSAPIAGPGARDTARNVRPPPPEPRSAAAPPPRPRVPTAAPPSSPRSPAPPSRQTAQPAADQAPAPAPAQAPVATARPSFDCRKARTRGEIAVCNDPELASLDRQMSAQFYRALSAASPGARLMLQRTRTRFLRYRDSCGSSACIAEAYSARMREISDIMARF